MLKSKREKNEKLKRRYEAIKDLMSTFAMSTVAVVAVVVLVPASPKAEITRVIALSEEVSYSVTVTDEDSALDLDSLVVVLENQLEYYEEPLSLGENTGYFTGLMNETQYRLSVYGNKGFGQERLDTRMITTGEKVGGTILSITPETLDYQTTYYIDVSYYDPDSTYSSITLYYGYQFEQDIDIQYTAVSILSSPTTIEITNADSMNPLHVYLEGVTVDGTEILDEATMTPPFQLYASMYLSYITKDAAWYSVYSDMGVGDVTYQMNIYQHDMLIRTEKLQVGPNDFQDSPFVISDLSPSTTYNFECIAIYQNPRTLREEQTIIYQEEVTTLDPYSYTYTIDTFTDYIEVTIQLDDPSDYFQEVYYQSYDISGDYDMYLNGESFIFQNIDNKKSVTFTIPIPTASTYKIEIIMHSQMNYNINQIVETIIVE